MTNSIFKLCLDRCCAPGLAIDLGANMGEWSQVMLDHGFRVLAVEPGTDCWNHLVKRFDQIPNIELLHAAAHNYDGTVQLYEHSCNWMNSVNPDLANIKRWGFDIENYCEVTAVRLDSLAERMDMSDLVLIKIDVESSEQWVLEGAAQVIQRFRPLIYLETHSAINSAAINQLFNSWDYVITSDGHSLTQTRDLNDGNDNFICFHRSQMPV